MVPRVDPEVVNQSSLSFSRAPGASKEAVDVGPKHGAGVIEGEKRIKTDFLELPLTRDAASFSWERMELG